MLGKAFFSGEIERQWITVDTLASWLQSRVSERTQDTQFPQYERLDFGTKGNNWYHGNTQSLPTKNIKLTIML